MEWEVIKWLLGILELVVIGWMSVMFNDIKKNREETAAHRLHAAETYMTKTESTRAFDTLSRTLETMITTINSRFDRMDSKLDSKMDKGE